MQDLNGFSFLCCSFVSRGFGEVSRALDTATGGEVNVNSPCSLCCSPGLSPLLTAGAAALSRAVLKRHKKHRLVPACKLHLEQALWTGQILSGHVSCNWPPREQRNGLLECHFLITPMMSSNHKALWHSLALPFHNHLLHVCCGLMLPIFSNYSFSMSFEVAIKKISVRGVGRTQLTVNEIRIMESNRSPRIVNYLAR